MLRPCSRLVFAAVLVLAGFAARGEEHRHGAAAAKDVHAHHGQAAAKPPAGAIVRLAEARLLDQDGKPRRLKADVLGDRVIVVNFVYTSCTTVCPVQSAIFENLQQKLGARLGREVQLVSISVDPLRDTPARLRELADRHRAQPGWTLLTGRKTEVDAVLKAFGAYTPEPSDHPAMVMVGSLGSERWTRLFGFPSVDELNSRIEQALAAARPPAAHAHHN